MKSTLLLILLLCGRHAVGAVSQAAEREYGAARTAYLKLKGDSRQRAFRHHWLRVITRLERVARHETSPRAPEALFLAGQAGAELHRLSRREDDRRRSRVNYEKLVTTWPTHRLADDALVALAAATDERQTLRQLVALVRPHANDHQRELDRILAELGPLPRPKRADALAPRRGRLSLGSSDVPKESRKLSVSARMRSSDDGAATGEGDGDGSTDTPSAAAGRSAVAEAIMRAVGPLKQLEGPPSAGGAVHEREGGAGTPTLGVIQERLRQVRVGDRPPAPTERVQAERLRALSRAQRPDLSLAQQLGLKVRRVVIDAGHGGHDTGAIGPSGVEEKVVALSIALKLAALLRERGLEVVLTREDDAFVSLEKRAAMANELGGDLFLSIHCNAAAKQSLRGVETYSLNTGSSRYAVRLAARENASSERGVSDLRYVLADLATKANTQESQALARAVQRSIVDSLSATYSGVRDLGTKEALFLVLLGARMPAVLVETSFLSNPEEEKRLADDSYQQAVAQAVASAVADFVAEREIVAVVD